MHSVNPIIIPRNHKVEEALTAANNGDLEVMNKLLAILVVSKNEELTPKHGIL